MSAGSFGPWTDPTLDGESPVDAADGEPRPYTTRAAERPYTTRPYTTRPYTTRPYTTRPYTTRPYTTRESGPFDADGRGVLDPLEWSEDVSQAFFGRSALLQLGARLVAIDGSVPLPKLGTLTPTQNLVPTERADPAEEKLDIGTELRPGAIAFSVRVGIGREQVDQLARTPALRWTIKDDIARALALRADTEMLARVAAAGPAHADAEQDVGPTLRAVIAAVTDRGPACEAAGWLLSPGKLAAFAASDASASADATRLVVPYPPVGSSLLGYPSVASAVADDAVWFSWDWSEVWIAVTARLVTVDIQSQPGEDWTVLGASVRCDVAVRRPELICTTGS